MLFYFTVAPGGVTRTISQGFDSIKLVRDEAERVADRLPCGWRVIVTTGHPTDVYAATLETFSGARV